MFIADSLCDMLVASSQLHMRPQRHGVQSIAMAEVTSFKKLAALVPGNGNGLEPCVRRA